MAQRAPCSAAIDSFQITVRPGASAAERTKRSSSGSRPNQVNAIATNTSAATQPGVPRRERRPTTAIASAKANARIPPREVVASSAPIASAGGSTA